LPYEKIECHVNCYGVQKVLATTTEVKELNETVIPLALIEAIVTYY